MKYAYMVGLLVIVFAVLLGTYFLQSRQGVGFKQKHRWVSYLLVWPLILDANKKARGGSVFTGREWLGWVAVAALIAVGVLFFS